MNLGNFKGRYMLYAFKNFLQFLACDWKYACGKEQLSRAHLKWRSQLKDSNISPGIQQFNNSSLSTYCGLDTALGTEDKVGTRQTAVCSPGTLVRVEEMGNQQVKR